MSRGVPLDGDRSGWDDKGYPTVHARSLQDGTYDYHTPLSVYNKTSTPGVGDDNLDGFRVGSRWFDTTNDRAYECLDASTGAAVWREIGGSGSLANHDHSGDAGDGGTFNAGNLTSGAASDGWVLTADGSGGSDFEALPAGGGDMTYAAVQAMQLVNEIKGWHPYTWLTNNDLATLGLWWDAYGTPTTAAAVVLSEGDGLTDTYERSLKSVTDAASEGFYQRFTYADEPRVKSGRVISMVLAIWCVSGVSVTAGLYNSTGTSTTAVAVTAAAWTLVRVENHTCAGTYVDLRVTAGSAGTFYVVPLGMNIGTKAFQLADRPIRWVEKHLQVLADADLAGAGSWTDLDLTSSTSPLTLKVELLVSYANQTTAGTSLKVRRNGDTAGSPLALTVVVQNTSYANMDTITSGVDDSQIIEYYTGAAAGDVELINMYLKSYWEWG